MEEVIKKIKSVDYDNVTQEVVSDVIGDILKLNDEEVLQVLLFMVDDLPIGMISRDHNPKEKFYSDIFNNKRIIGFKKDLEEQIKM